MLHLSARARPWRIVPNARAAAVARAARARRGGELRRDETSCSVRGVNMLIAGAPEASSLRLLLTMLVASTGRSPLSVALSLSKTAASKGIWRTAVRPLGYTTGCRAFAINPLCRSYTVIYVSRVHIAWKRKELSRRVRYTRHEGGAIECHFQGTKATPPPLEHTPPPGTAQHTRGAQLTCQKKSPKKIRS